jgi:hypothetical protein
VEITAAEEDDRVPRLRRGLGDAVLREVEERLGGRKQQFLEGKAAFFIKDNILNIRNLGIADAVGTRERTAAFKAHGRDNAAGSGKLPKKGVDAPGTEFKAHRITSFSQCLMNYIPECALRMLPKQHTQRIFVIPL